MTSAANVVRSVRAEAGLSLRALANAAGLAVSTVHRIERGDIQPTIETLDRIATAAGARLRVEAELDSAVSAVGLARAIRADLARGDEITPVRRAAELARRYETADADTRRRMITASPPSIGDHHWDALVAALAEWLAVRAGALAPDWTHDRRRYLSEGWWVTPMSAMHAWEYAGSPASFKTRGVYIHRDSLVNV